MTNKIEVVGFVNSEELDLDLDMDKLDTKDQLSTQGKKYEPKEINKRDSAYLKDYLEELDAIKEISKEEEKNLIFRLMQGDSAAKQGFIEINLRKVVEIAGEFKNQGMTAEDLIQEGNMALLQLVNDFPQMDDIEGVRQFVCDYIRNYIKDVIMEQQESDNIESMVMQKMNQIYDSLKELEEQLDRKASISELANFMNVTEEEIQNILELSADILDLGEEIYHHDQHCHGHNHDHNCNCHEEDHRSNDMKDY
ncbi:MAG: hypothetical protein GX359_07165 [Clostridiales bacterium]|nr:hypothetical protein [Clostridiales bacterium]